MDISSGKWLSEMEMDDFNFIHQCHINSLADFTTQNMATALGENFQQSFSSESHSSYPNFNTKNNTTTFSGSSIETTQTSLEKPTKLLKTNSWNSSTTTEILSPKSSSPTSQLLSFKNSNSPPINSQQFYGNLDCYIKAKDETALLGNMHLPAGVISQGDYENINYAPNASQGTKRPHTTIRTPSHAQDHILAERKRREKLSQRFIALSAIVPGLKKMDKASVLGDSIKYVKQLQERVKVLEEQTKKRTVESVVFVKKSQLSTDEESSTCNEIFDKCPDKALPEIEAKVSDKDVLIRIHCEKQKGFLVKILSEIERLHLSIVNSSALPFGNSTLDITIIAQKDDEFNMTVKDLVKNLRMAFLEFM